MNATVQPRKRGKWQPKQRWYGGGPAGALRAYQAYHPGAAIYTIEHRGQERWVTDVQLRIWVQCKRYWMRGKRDTLARIASVVKCSRATVSRFLHKLDRWRFIDLAAIRGRRGGIWIFTAPSERPQTKKQRYIAMVQLAWRVRRAQMIARLQPMIDEYRRTHPYPTMRGLWWDEGPKAGKTSATFRDTYGARRRHG